MIGDLFMLYFIKGKIEEITDKYIILDSGNWGFKVFVTKETLSNVEKGNFIKLYTYLYLYDDIIDLYGFLTKEELDLFELLISISGIGPKVALSILSLGPVKVLVSAIFKGDINYLTKVAGVGQKIAQKIIFELQEKIKKVKIQPLEELPDDADVIEALKSLGYSLREAQQALKEVSDKHKGSKKRLQEALRILSKK